MIPKYSPSLFLLALSFDRTASYPQTGKLHHKTPRKRERERQRERWVGVRKKNEAKIMSKKRTGAKDS